MGGLGNGSPGGRAAAETLSDAVDPRCYPAERRPLSKAFEVRALTMYREAICNIFGLLGKLQRTGRDTFYASSLISVEHDDV